MIIGQNLKNNTQTELLHAERKAPQYISTVQPPLFRASTIIFQNTDALFNRHWSDPYDYSYGTHGTPTTFTLSDQIAQIEGGNGRHGESLLSLAVRSARVAAKSPIGQSGS